MRTFNAFGASLKLALSGYTQIGVLILRDILETVFLLNLFRRDRTLIERWRFADEQTRRQEFSPAAVRKALDERDGFRGRKREEMYPHVLRACRAPDDEVGIPDASLRRRATL